LNRQVNGSLPFFPEQIARVLNSRSPRKLVDEDCGRAAVLMLVFQGPEDYCFLLTLRTQAVETHKGQISFPGGVKEPEDQSMVETALRETWEEIGLPRTSIQVLGEFDDYRSVTDLIVTPYVGWVVPPLSLVPNRNEVEEVLEVPLSLFRDKNRLRVESKKRCGQEYPVYFYNFGRKEIWGLTARIIRDFLMLIDGED